MLILTSDHNINIWIIVPWCQGHSTVSIKDDALFKYTATTTHMLKFHYNIGNMDNPVHILFFQPILTWQALIIDIIMLGPWNEVINAIMILFLPH